MGGICGFFSKRNITLDDLGAMNRTMKNRGGFDAGAEIYVARKEYTVGLAGTRLAMTDAAYSAHQPMRSADGRVSIVFEGEIYNADELRQELSDYSFRSRSDTEVLLAGFLKWGAGIITRLSGMFALAIYDADKEALLLARDPVGEKPLYYELEKTQRGINFYFGSTLSPLMRRPGFVRKANPEIVRGFLKKGYIDGPETVFTNVYKLLPGTYAQFFLNSSGVSEFEKTAYYDLSSVCRERNERPVTDLEEAKHTFLSLGQAAVRSMLPSSGKRTGMILDGSISSYLVAGLLQHELGDSLLTFTPGHDDTPYLPAEGTRLAAEYLGSAHTEVHLTDKELLSHIRVLPRIFDEPFADPKGLVSSLLYGRMKEETDIAFTGTCILSGAASASHKGSPEHSGLLERIKHLFAEKSPDVEKETPYENTSSLADRVLLSDDRAAMLYALELRSPLLSKELFTYPYRILERGKNDKNVINKLLRAAAEEFVPRELWGSSAAGPKVPTGAFLRGPLKQQLLDMCSGTLLSNQGLFDREWVRNTVGEYLKRPDPESRPQDETDAVVWSYFVFQQWYEEYFGN